MTARVRITSVNGKARTSAGGAVVPQVLHSPGLATHGIRAAVKFLAGVALTRPPEGGFLTSCLLTRCRSSHLAFASISWRVGRPPGQPPGGLVARLGSARIATSELLYYLLLLLLRADRVV